MRQTDPEERLRAAVTHAVPDVRESVLSAYAEQKKGTVIQMENFRQEKKKRRWTSQLAAVAAALAIFAGGAVGYGRITARAAAATIAFDVNPSVEVTVNRSERVLSARALNADGEAILADMDLAGADLDVAVNALIGSMLRGGFLSELQSSILITVDSKNSARGAALEKRLSEEVTQLLESSAITGAVLSQTAAQDEAAERLAAETGISAGKAALVQTLAAQDDLHTPEELAKLSINELTLLAESRRTDLGGVTAVGSASDKAYIGAEKALSLALAAAGVKQADAQRVKTELEYDDGRMVYEVEFAAGGMEYDYEFDARTGALLGSDIDRDDWEPVPPASPAPSTAPAPSASPAPSTAPAPSASPAPAAQAAHVGVEKAKTIALAHAGIAAADAAGFEVDLDFDDGPVRYELEFHAGGYEYDYDIDAVTGAVIKAERETDDDAPRTSAAPAQPSATPAATPQPSAEPAAYIGVEKAKSLALAKAGVTAAAELEAELEEDDGRMVYEVSFKAGGMEYDGELDARTGAFLKWESEPDD